MNPVIERVVSRFVHRFVARYYVQITLSSLVVTALSVWAIAVHWNINSDLKALLPTDSRAAEAMNNVGERVGSGSALFVVVDSPSMEKNKAFARDFTERLRTIDSVALAHFHNDKSFFEKHKLLYLKPGDLEKIRERIAERIEEAKKEANPLFASLDSDDEEEDDFIETDDLRGKYDHLAHRGQSEYFTSRDGFSLTIIVRFTEPSTDLVATNRLIQRVREVGRQLDPSSYHAEMDLEYGGGLINRKEDYGEILSDIKSSAVFTVLGLLLVIGLYFRRVRATALIMMPLVMGVCWTLAVAFMGFGELNTVSVFIFAILLGLGIDYSIHLLSGYDHARMEGRNPIEALVRTYQGVGSATTIGAITTLATFIVISFADFRGLSQFGQVATIGVAFTLTAMIVVLPALILTFHSLVPHEVQRDVGRDGSIQPYLTKEVVGRYAPLAIALAVAFSALSITQYPGLRFEENFRDLGEINWPWEENSSRPGSFRQRRDAREKAEEVGFAVSESAIALRRRIDPDSFAPMRIHDTTEEKFESALRGQRSSTPTVLLFDDADEARAVSEYMRTLHREGRLETVQSISSVYAFSPGTTEEQKRRMEEIRKIRALLESEDLSVLEEDARERLEDFREKLDVEPVSIYELPEWTKRLFHEAGEGGTKPKPREEYAFEYVIYVNEAIDQMRGKLARKFLEEIQGVREETGADFQIGSQSFIYVRMLDEIKRDGLVMISIALVVVLLILSLAFRSPLRGLVAMTPLICGAAWMFGALAAIGISLDFFNVIVIPVVIGIGVDAGVHFYRRYLERGRGSIGVIVRTVGAAVTMASVTSGIGFGGLAVTDQGGLTSMGHLAIVGLSTTLAATLLIMPVVLWFAETYDIDALLPRESDLAD